MANQKVMLKVVDRQAGPQDVRVVLVDSDGGAATFTDNGAATFIVSEGDWMLVDVQGQGTTAPATATAFQFNVNRLDTPMYINGAATFDPTSTAKARLGAAFGKKYPKGTTFRLTGRA